jgi:hypothetical protein
MQKEMNILYNDAVTFEQLEPFDDIAQFEYMENTLVDSTDKQSSFDTFVSDVEDVIQGKYNNNSIEYPQSHFTVLPILYKELSEGGCMYPMYKTSDPTSPMRETGKCRTLILSHFLPQTPIDRVIFQPKPGGKLSNLIDLVRKGKEVDQVSVLSCMGTMWPRRTYIMGIEFDQKPHPLGPWSGKIYDESDLWCEMKRLIIKSDGNYKKLLDKLVHFC